MAEPVRRTGGRSARVRHEVLAATQALLLEEGLEATTITAVAERSGVHHTSIYRRWGDRATLVRDALLGAVDSAVPVQDTGSLYDELVQMLDDVLAMYQSALGPVLLDLIRSNEPSLAELQVGYLDERLKLCAEVIERAKERGELPRTVDHRLVFELLIGPVLGRALLTADGVRSLDSAAIVRAALYGVCDGQDRELPRHRT
ncbi:TetR/AcrR family transcriptional regulator [Streptomyces sp. NPDC056835]|uniref:TetR/AcrR family transcriptional regulator n=1 Tax=Streptomyces sp. NPDC056835 TaxID=3345956 RepID=UPI0036BD0719